MPVGVYKRTEYHKKITARAMRKVWRERRKRSEEKEEKEEKSEQASEEKSEQAPEEKNKFDSVRNRIENLDREQLLDALTQCRADILMRVKILSQHWNWLISMQKRRDEIEKRLEELGGSMGKLQSSAKNWKEE